MGTILFSIGLFHAEEIINTSKCLDSLVSDVSLIFTVGLLSKPQKQHVTILQESLLGTSCTLSNSLKIIFENEIEILMYFISDRKGKLAIF